VLGAIVALAVVAAALGAATMLTSLQASRVDDDPRLPRGRPRERERAAALDLGALSQDRVLRGDSIDVVRSRERTRRRRLLRALAWLAPVVGWMYWRIVTGNPVRFGLPELDESEIQVLIPLLAIVLIGVVLVMPFAFAGRSPHVRYAASEIDVTFDDVVGIGPVREEVVKTLNLFLAYQTFRDRMGGNPRKAILFEGPPGTGKTHMAKAMAREAGVPYLFVSATAFQSMYYGQTGRKIRSYFKALRKAAREEGGAIGFIEEIDAIAGARSGMRRSSPLPSEPAGPGSVHVDRSGITEGISGVVNELLIQLQSFDQPTFGQRVRGGLVDWLNRWLPPASQLRKKPPTPSNVLVIGATNRASDLDPALLRPGRFDRSIHFGLPSRSGRREIVDYYLAKKAHVPELDKEERRDQLAAMTFGYSPVMIEHLFDEALVWALRDGRESMDWRDVQQAKLTEEIGLKQPVEYSDDEKLTIATHEAGHAVVAHLVGHDRKLEVLSIIKRRDALGLLAHSDKEERWTKTRSELLGAIKIAFGGMTAEELFFGESGTGPSGDLAHATRIAAQMVGSFGMAGSLVSLDAVEPGPIAQGIVGKVLANDDSRQAVEHILENAKNDVRLLLDQHRHLVAALRDELLEREELVGDEIVDVLHEAEQRRQLGLE
jgi:ATP-dependent Zn protease